MIMAENHFDADVAMSYRERWPELFDPAAVDPVVDLLSALAGTGPVLEFGVGTGRIALPIHRRGIAVHGIDLSPAMITELRRQPGGTDINTVVGDIASTTVPESFSLVYLLRNTIMNLTSQDDQVACFQNAARHLEPGGCFLIEVLVPELRRLPPGERLHTFIATDDHLGYEEYDFATQTSISHHYWMLGDRLERRSIPFRYAWPSELDLMARIAGLTLRHRWSGWHREPFTGESRQHVSVWQRPLNASPPR